MPEQQGQGHFPTSPPGNASAGPAGTQRSAADIASDTSPVFEGNGKHLDPSQPAKIQPNG
jgi:hypothetical protein